VKYVNEFADSLYGRDAWGNSPYSKGIHIMYWPALTVIHDPAQQKIADEWMAYESSHLIGKVRADKWTYLMGGLVHGGWEFAW
jgi:hypothetical protein